jgi:tetratricopeptide (TPR) repeat protein
MKDGPPAAAPAHEMMGDMLLDLSRSEPALLEYEAELKVSPNRFNSLYGAGRAAEQGNNPSKAAAYYQQLLKACATGTSNRAELAHAKEFLSSMAKQN